MNYFDDLIPGGGDSGGGGFFDDLIPAKPSKRAVPEKTAGSVLRDVASGALQIGPTAVKGVADIARLATGDRIGTGLSGAMEEGMQAIRDTVGSERAAVQRANFAQDMADDSVGIGDALLNNKGALADQLLPTVGSMFLPVGVAAGAGKFAAAGAQALDKAAIAARVAAVQTAAGIGAVAAQNAADTFSELLEKGASMSDAYLGAGITVPFSVVAGKLTGGGAEGAITRALTGTGAAKQGVTQLAKAAGREGGQEMGEELGQIAGEAVGLGEAPSLQSAGKQLAVAGALGAVMGGGVDVATQVRDARAPAAAPTMPMDTPDGQVEPFAGDAGAAAEGMWPTGLGAEPSETAAAEDALRAPVTLTALDRANEIDSKSANIRERLSEISPENGYGPAFDLERQSLAAEAALMEQERTSIASTWPTSVKGAPTSFSTETNARLDGQYALMDASDLVTSHDQYLKPNPLYPPELQPRDRSRDASQIQVSNIAQRLDPARLGLSADAATGAPIVGADGLVESGNARTIALKRIYALSDGNGETQIGTKAHEYREFLKANAAQFGLTPEAVDGMPKAVLVRVRSTPVNRAEFARQANASTVQRMSPSEQALSDARRIVSLDGLNPTEDGDFSASTDFIRHFRGTLPLTEQGEMMESDGKLSTAGYRRVQNAVLARAYGDSPSLRRMTESLDNNLVNVSKALLRVAPTIAAARERMEAGTLHSADIAPDLLSAVEGLSALKEKGWTAAQEMAQTDLTGPRYTPEAAELLSFLADNARSPRRIAEFVQRYYEALEQAGDPSQPSMFGDDGPAPARADLLKQAQGDTNVERATNDAQGAGQDPQRGVNREGAQADAKGGRQPEDAPGNRRGDQGDGASSTDAGRGQPIQPAGKAANDETSEWVAFSADSGTLGIPRRDMPQVKAPHRGALVNFLQARGIEAGERTEAPADSLKPTQAEFSRSKVERFMKTGPMGERSVLVSSDGYVLDGHHQWMAAKSMGVPVPVIRLGAPIQELIAAVREFPSVQQSEGADSNPRALAVQDFKDAMADLAQIATKHTRAAMVPEKTPDLMPTLVKLFDAAIRLVGTDIKATTAWVKAQLKADSNTKAFWNKIGNDLYRKAALQALESMDQPAQKGLFEDGAAAAEAVQGDLFGAAAPKASPKVATINGRAYDIGRDNFKPPAMSSFMPQNVLTRADGYVEQFYSKAQPYAMSADERAKAARLLEPFLARAGDAKATFDQKIIDLVASTEAVGQMLADIKSIKRASEKMHQDATEEGREMRATDVKDLLRSTVVVQNYETMEPVLEAIRSNFEVVREKNKMTPEAREQQGGYADFTVFVKMPNGVLAEIQINTPEMLAAKSGHGHKLFEAARDLPSGSDKQAGILAAMTEIYQAAFNAAAERFASNAREWAIDDKNAASDAGAPVRGPRGSMPGSAVSEAPSSEALNQRPSGNLTNSSPEKPKTNSQPSGNLSGTLIEDPFNSIVGEGLTDSYNSSTDKGANDADTQPGEGSAESEIAQPAQEPVGGGATQPVRGGSRRPNQRPGGDADAGAADQGGVGQTGPRGVRSQDADGQQPAPRSGARADAGIPAGRDIPPKSGRNYRFGPDDLTYQGSWAKKAEQNVEAVELLQALDKAGRAATREEQATLAKFVGWGSSEIANNLFGDKLDKASASLASYDKAIAAMDAKKASELVAGGYRQVGYRRQYIAGDPAYMDAFRVLQAKDAKFQYNPDRPITRADLDAAKPDGSTRKWIALRDRLKAALSAQEWAEASRSTQYAHYTSKEVVRSMWRALDRMGFKGGSVLEPGAGIGVFPGLMPEAMAANSIYTGVEYDTITGKILKQLFPDERVLVESFIDSKLPKNFYDVAVGNPPFSGTKVLSDPEYAKRALSLHDYFFAKSIDRTKPGGLVVYVTSRYTMDKLDDKARAYLSERADLVGAIRLPQTAFKQNAGTEVVTDVIFLRKKVPGETFAAAQPWAKSVPLAVNGAEYNVNEYFLANPAMVLGTHADTGSMYKDRDYTVTPKDGDIEAHFDAAVQLLPSGIYQAERGSSAEAAQVREIDFNPKAKKEGNYYVTDAGVLMVREGGVGQRVELRSPKDAQLIKDFVPLRDALKQAHFDQLNDGAWQDSLKALQKAYADFTAAHGQVNQFVTKVVKSKAVDEETGEAYSDETLVRTYPLLKKLEDDPDYTLVAALETINDDTGEIKPSSFLSERVLGRPADVQVNGPVDALLSTLNDVGRVDIPLIAKRAGLSEADTIEALGSAVYEDPESGWLTADGYLSGNVKSKLETAREAAKADRRYERNIAALEAVQPAPKTPSQINVSIGMNWVPGDVYSEFLRDTASVRAEVQWNARTRQWIVQEQSGGHSMAATADWGTADRNTTELLEHALTGRPVRITRTVGSGSTRTTQFDATATEAANQKLEALRDRFSAWVWENPQRADQLVRIYNDTFNTTVPRAFDGSHLTLPGSSKTFSVFDHVKRGAWRIVQDGNTYLAHAVGSGKTFQMVIANMEQKRLGLIKKPMVVVPNHMLKQFAHEWQMLYPAARLMVADENNFHSDNRRRFVSRVALSDLDGVIITHSAFKLLDMAPEFKKKIIDEQLDFLRAALEEAQSEDGKGGKKSPRIKQIEKQIENLEEKLKAALASTGKDANVRFDELGVDHLMVDEAHEFRKLDFATSRQVKGISPQGSARALDLYIKARYLEEKNPGRSLVMASGTPVTNTQAELYTVQKFMDRQAMIDRGIDDFDSWAAMFGRERTVLEPNAAGKYEPVTRFSKFVNVPELTQMFREFADVLTSDHLAALMGDKRPKVRDGSRKMFVTPKTSTYVEYQKALAARVEASRNWKPSKEEPNNPDPVIAIIGDGRLAAIDMRFVAPGAASDPDSKLNRMIDDVIRVFQETADMEYRDKAGNVEPNKGAAMMVFSDMGFGAGVAANRGFNARAWFEKRLRDSGVPMGQVAFMSDYKKSSDKLKLFKDVNAGRVRLLVGSSKNMGTGVNAQQRLKALFHLDSPWYPADLEQREGRIVRQGNKNPLVDLYAYAAKGTYDENMWKMLASKQYFIDQALSGDENLRELEDLDSQSQYDLAAAMVAEDPRIMQLAGARAEIEKLQRLYRAHEDQRYRFKGQFEQARSTAEFNQARLPEAERLAALAQDLSGDNFIAKVGGKAYTDRAKWGEALVERYKLLTAKADPKPVTIGEISGFPLVFGGETVAGQYTTKVLLATATPVELVTDPGTSPVGVAMRAQNAVADVQRLPAKMRQRITEARAQMDGLSTRLESPFPMSGMLADKVNEAKALEAEIAFDSKPRTWRVERKSDRLGFDVQATNADEAIMAAIKANGGAAEDWVAIDTKDALPSPDTRLSRGASSQGGMPVADLKALASRLRAAMPNMPKVNVLADPSEAPYKLREYINRQDAWYDVEGAMHNGELYLFASGLQDAARAEHVLAEHEAAHFGLRAVLGPRGLAAAMRMVWLENAAVRKAASQLQKRGKLSDAAATEEVIVDFPSSELAALKGWRKVVLKARDYLAERGYSALAQRLTLWLDGTLTQQQRADLFVADLVRAARDYVRGARAGSPRGYMGVTRLSSSLTEDLARQEQWLNKEARARGFKDIDDLVDRNYPVFEKLAALWRKKNPADEGVMLSRSADVDAYAKAVRQWQEAMGRVPTANTPLAEAGQAIGMPVPAVFSAIGLKSPKLTLPVRYMQGIREKHRDLPAAALRDLPQLLSDPVLVIPYVSGGYRAVIDASTAKGEMIVVGIGADGRVQTITPMHDEDGMTGRERFAAALEIELTKPSAKVYARNKEALAETRASRGVAMGTLNPNHASSTGAVPAIIALHRTPRDKANVIYRGLVVKQSGEFGPGIRLSRAAPAATKTAAQRADDLIQAPVLKGAPLDAITRGLTRAVGLERLTGAIYDRAAVLLDRYTPERVKAGVVSDYGVPEAVIDQRTMLQGRQRVQLRKAGALIEKLATLTRAESRVAYEWMNMDGADPQAYVSMMQGLPEESVKVLQEVQQMIDKLSQDAVRLGQLDPEAFKRNRFAYLRRSYAKHTLEQTSGEKAKRARTIAVLGEQYKGRGLTESAPMDKIKAAAPEWWGRKLAKGKGDTGLKGEKFIRLERRAPSGERTKPLEGMGGKQIGRLQEVAYWPAGERVPAAYADWTPAGTWEVRDVKGPNVVFWRDFTKAEREQMGEIDEARFAIAKTLHAMIQDVEIGRYLEWLAATQAKKEGETIPGVVVDASERMRDTFAPGEWVRVPDSKIQGTSVLKYGKLAGRYLPGPVWNDLRQIVAVGRFQPFGETYAKVLSLWKTSKTALSPAVHMNNVMSNFVMADWHDVRAAHVSKSLRILLAANQKRGGIADREAALELLNRYQDSGGDAGSWVTQEISRDQIQPLLETLEKELVASDGAGTTEAQTGVYAALQHAMHLRFPESWDAAIASIPGKAAGKVGGALIDMYQAEDDVFRLAAWLAAKEDGASDLDAGKRARKSFLDYSINAPWINAMRASAWPFLSFTYRAVPMLLETAARKPHKLMKLMAIAGGLNALGAMMAGGGGDDERKMLPEEKAGGIWGMVPKLIRMPWNDQHGSAVFLDIRRWVPVGDVLDVGQGHAAVPILPGLMPGGPLVLMGEVVLNRSAFTGKPITLETDTPSQQAAKVGDFLYKAFAPNILGLPNTYATEGVKGSLTGRTDAFGREMSTAQAMASSFGLKLGSYPADVMRRNLTAAALAQSSEIEKNIAGFKRQRQTGRIDDAEFQDLVAVEQEKKVKLMRKLAEKTQ